MCTFYVSFVVIIIFFANRTLVPNPWDNFANARYFVVSPPLFHHGQFSFQGIAECVPMILFAYMYQVNIPMIYNELERRNRKRMGKVVWRGSMAGIFLYASVGVFGYLTFYNKPEELLKQNILLADYHMNVAVIIGQVTSFISVYVAMPLLYLPAKETVEELFFRGRKMKPKQNLLVTFILVVTSFVFAIFVPSIGDAMALAGCTTNPMVSVQNTSHTLQIGFLIPVMMYWEIHKDKPIMSKEKLLSGGVFVIIVLTSILGLINFIVSKTFY